MAHPTRRDLFRAAPLAAAPFLGGTAGAQEPPRYPGMTVRMRLPENLEFPFSELKSFITPTERLFIRSHFPVPKIDPATWRLTVEGAVEKKLELTLDDIKKFPPVTMPLTLECAGNGRVFLVPQARGLQWGLGAVGTAEWTGVPLAAILEKAGVKPGAVEVILVGTDVGTIATDPASPGPIAFDRSIPLEKARKPEVLLAYGMNGEDLTPSHGFPLRAVVGGWFGMASVKWLSRIVVTDKPYAGFWQTYDYAYFERRDGKLPQLTPITKMLPKASIAQPTLAENVPAGKPYTVHGAAWAGESAVSKVEVSTDGGTTWALAKLTGPEKPFCWRTWEFLWQVPAAKGPMKIVARATDSAGATQPDQRNADRRSYMIDHLVPVDVLVR